MRICAGAWQRQRPKMKSKNAYVFSLVFGSKLEELKVSGRMRSWHSHCCKQSRNPTTRQAAIEDIQKEANNTSKATFISVDLSDLKSILSLVDHIQNLINQVILLNTFYWPEKYQVSKQRHEITYAANQLGPHLLLCKLFNEDVLRPNGRVIITARGSCLSFSKGTL